MERSQNSLESPIKQILLLDCIRNVPDDENKKGQIGSILSNEQNACSKTNWRASYMQFEQTFFKKKTPINKQGKNIPQWDREQNVVPVATWAASCTGKRRRNWTPFAYGSLHCHGWSAVGSCHFTGGFQDWHIFTFLKVLSGRAQSVPRKLAFLMGDTEAGTGAGMGELLHATCDVAPFPDI